MFVLGELLDAVFLSRHCQRFLFIDCVLDESHVVQAVSRRRERKLNVGFDHFAAATVALRSAAHFVDVRCDFENAVEV